MDYIERLIHNIRLEVEEVQVSEDRVDDLSLVKYYLQKAEEHYKKVARKNKRSWYVPPAL